MINVRFRIAFFLLIFLAVKVKSQQIAIPYKTIISGGQYSSDGSPWQSPQVYKKTATQLEVDDFIFGTAAKVDLLASDYIRIKPTTRAGSFYSNDPNWNPYFHAGIDPNMLNIASYHPNGFVNIPQYDKFELGIKLPEEITQKVDDFFGKFKNGTHNGYGSEFKQGPSYPNNINPYDPDQISVEATFSFPNKPAQTIYGFYYREYNYSGNYGNSPDYLNMDWVENLDLKYHWRVRFAPKHVGQYQITWTVKVNGVTILTDNVGQIFSVVPSNNEGFLKLGQNKKFLVTKPNDNSNEKTVIPVGVVHSIPEIAYPAPPLNVPTSDVLPWGSPDIEFPSRYYIHRKEIIDNIAKKGANLVRVYTCQQGYLIENEHVGIYDGDKCRPLETGTGIHYNNTPGLCTPLGVSSPIKYKGTNRQAAMSEFDKLLDEAHENNLYIQWMIEDPNLFNIYPGNQLTWVNHPYYKELFEPQNQDPNSIVEFFINPKAKKAYKNRLRYIFARYGYSTNIAVFEMFNEIQHLNPALGGDNNFDALDAYFKPWLEEMLYYIKNELNHKDHLFTVSYEEGFGGDDIWNLPNVDFTCSHPYNWHGSNSFGSVFVNDTHFVNKYHKPYQAGEMGLSATRNPKFAEYMGPTFHTLLWSTAFTGAITSGLDMWGDKGTKIPPIAPQWPRECAGNFVEHFTPLRNFIQNISFDEKNYIPKEYHNQDGKIETFYLIENNGINADNAIGYVRNKSFWWANLGLLPSEVNEYNLAVGNAPHYLENQPVLNGNLGQIFIQGLKWNSQYIVEWYDTYNGSLISSTPFTSFGDTKFLTPPNFGGTCFNHEYAFKIKSLFQKSASNSDSTNSDLQSLELGTTVDNSNLTNPNVKKEIGLVYKDVKVYPNPVSDIVHIKFDKTLFKENIIELYDLSGRLIIKQNNVNELNTAQIENGAYMLKFSSDGYVKTFKINILH